MTQTDQRKIVILDKDQSRRDYLKSIVSGRGYVPFIFEKETICLDNLVSLQPDLVISGPLTLNRMHRFVNTVKMMDSSLPLLILSGDLSINDFASSNGFGDIKVLEINFEPAEIKGAISKMLHNRFDNKENGEQENHLIIGNSNKILRIRKKIRRLNHFKEPVMIQGEPGTGKELVARAIHQQWAQKDHPFVKVHMGDINLEMLNDIISSVKKDGLQNLNPRSSEIDNNNGGGTLFLDEIALLTAAGQSRLLAIFEQGSFVKVDDMRAADNASKVAIIVSSSRLLDKLVKRGKFRKDLYFRMSAVPIMIPPLRERINDIPMLADFFADKLCLDFGAGHLELSKKLKESFCRYPWPGNVRELKSIVQRAVLYGEKDAVIQNLVTRWSNQPYPLIYDEKMNNLVDQVKLQNYMKDNDNLHLKNICKIFLLRAEKKIIKKALEKTNWNRKKAARMLEISYKSLLNKIKEYRLA